MKEYLPNVNRLKEVEARHKSGLLMGKPQLNWCDRAVEARQKFSKGFRVHNFEK